MTAHDDGDDSTDTEPPITPPASDEHTDVHEGEYPPALPLGEATVEIDISEQTYQRVCAVYRRHAREARANAIEPEAFDAYVMNHCATEVSVTVGGTPAAPPRVDD